VSRPELVVAVHQALFNVSGFAFISSPLTTFLWNYFAFDLNFRETFKIVRPSQTYDRVYNNMQLDGIEGAIPFGGREAG
jgi:hypothetical protein